MRALLRALVVILLLVIAGFLVLAYRPGSAPRGGPADAPVGTAGRIDVQRARERGAEIGEKTAVAAKEVGNAVGEAALTSKIKAKMALDDSVKSRSIDVTTEGSTVTLSGTVRSVAEHDRAVALAQETAGVSQVVDRLTIVPR